MDIDRIPLPPGAKVDLPDDLIMEIQQAIEEQPDELIVDMGELITPDEDDEDDEVDDKETDPEKRRLQAVAGAVATAGVRAPYYRPPLVTTVGGCAGTAFGCCTVVTAAGVISLNIARINRFGDNCPRRSGFLDTCTRQRFGCCSGRTGFNVACRNRLCTNDVLYARPRAVAGAAAVATATTRGGVATATAVAGVAARPRVVAVPRYVATPYVAPRTTAVATAVATAGVAARRPIARTVGLGYGGVGGLGYGGVGGLVY